MNKTLASSGDAVTRPCRGRVTGWHARGGIDGKRAEEFARIIWLGIGQYQSEFKR